MAAKASEYVVHLSKASTQDQDMANTIAQAMIHDRGLIQTSRLVCGADPKLDHRTFKTDGSARPTMAENNRHLELAYSDQM